MRRLGLFAVALLALGAAGWLAWPRLVFRLPGVVGRILDPIGAPQAVVWAPGPAVPAGPPSERPPNVVVIVADDLGWNDVSWNGGVAAGAVPTPHIDSIAREGVSFGAGYAGNATCAPSRAAILTGRYPTRFGFEFTPAPKAFMRLVARFPYETRRPVYFAEREAQVPPMSEQGLPPEEITLAELLRDRGYRTLALGKWHLGESAALRPTAQGFDEFLGFYPGGALYGELGDPALVEARSSLDPIDRFLWANLAFALRKDEGKRFRPSGYLTDVLADEAARAIDANRHRPFFLYLAFNAPHTPLQAPKADVDALAAIENPTLRVYGAMVRALDRGVGRVLEALRRNGLEENTLVLFVSDNGGADYVGLRDLNAPYRGWKMTFFEGGVRTPYFAKWPARLPRGARFDAPVAHVDVFATAAAAAGAALPTDRPMDGVDLVPYARGEAPGEPHEALFWRSGHYRTVLAGGWKLQVSERPPRTWLFHLGADPEERRELSAAEPARVAALRARLDAWEREQAPPAWPSLIEGQIYVDHPLGAPDLPADEFVYWAN
jgi:arylsulfatase A-like enzyme